MKLLSARLCMLAFLIAAAAIVADQVAQKMSRPVSIEIPERPR